MKSSLLTHLHTCDGQTCLCGHWRDVATMGILTIDDLTTERGHYSKSLKVLGQQIESTQLTGSYKHFFSRMAQIDTDMMYIILFHIEI